MKRLLKITCCLMMVFLLTACGGKKELTSKDMTDTLSNLGFSVTNLTSQMEDTSVKSVIAANNGKYQIECYVFSSEKAAKKAFDSNQKKFEKLNDTKGKISNKDKYDTYVQELSDTYNSLTRVGKNFIYASINSEYKKDFNKVMNKLGY